MGTAQARACAALSAAPALRNVGARNGCQCTWAVSFCICKQLAQPHVPPRPHTCPGRPACMPARHTRSASSASGAGHARPASAVRAPASAPPAPLDIAAQSHFVLVMSRPPPCLHIVHKYSA